MMAVCVLSGSALAQTTRPAEQPQSASPPRATREVRLNGTPFREAVDAFSDAVGVSVYANWRRLENEGIDPETPITLRVRGITFGKLLELMLDSVSPRLRYTVSDGVITIYTVPEYRANANEPPMVTRVYDVTDLMWVLPDLDPRGQGTTSQGGSQGSGGRSSGTSEGSSSRGSGYGSR